MSLPSYHPPAPYVFTAGAPYNGAGNPNSTPQSNAYGSAPVSTTPSAHGHALPPYPGHSANFKNHGRDASWGNRTRPAPTNNWQPTLDYSQPANFFQQPMVTDQPLRYSPGNKDRNQSKRPGAMQSFPSVPAFGSNIAGLPSNVSYPHLSSAHSTGHGRGRPTFSHGSRPNERGHGAPGPRQHGSNFNQNHKRSREQSSGRDHRPGKRSHSDRPQLSAPPQHGLPPKPPKPVAPRQTNKPKTKPRNVLGLLPVDDDAASSDDAADEEVALSVNDAGMGSQGGPVNLSSHDDIQRWIAERKKKFPTRANIAAKETQRSQAESLGKQQRVAVSAGSSTKPNLLAGYDSSDSEADAIQSTHDLEDSTTKSTTSRADSKILSPGIPPRDLDEPPMKMSSRKRDSVLEHTPVFNNNDNNNRTGTDQSITAAIPAVDNDQVYCKTWARLGFCTWKRCKFLHRLPGVDDSSANEEYAQKQTARHRRNLYQEFVKGEELEKQNVALQVIKFLGHAGQLS